MAATSGGQPASCNCLVSACHLPFTTTHVKPDETQTKAARHFCSFVSRILLDSKSCWISALDQCAVWQGASRQERASLLPLSSCAPA